jgi:hypothetical protein
VTSRRRGGGLPLEPVVLNHVAGLLRDHDGRGVGVAPDDDRHYRGVDDPQPPDPVNPEPGIDDGLAIAPRAHFAGAHRVKERRRVMHEDAAPVVVAVEVVFPAGGEGRLQEPEPVLEEGPAPEELAPDPDAGEEDLEVGPGLEVAGVHEGRAPDGVGPVQPDAAPTPGRQQDGPHVDPVVVSQGHDGRLDGLRGVEEVVPDAGAVERELNVRQVLAGLERGLDEGPASQRAQGRQGPGPRVPPPVEVVADLGLRLARGRFVAQDDYEAVGGHVVVEVLAHRGVVDDVDPVAAEGLRRPNARELQQLRRVYGARGEDHLLAGLGQPRQARPRGVVLDAGGRPRPWVYDDAGHVSLRRHDEVRSPLADGPDEGAVGALTGPVRSRRLHVDDADVLVGVGVYQFVADLLPGLNQDLGVPIYVIEPLDRLVAALIMEMRILPHYLQ